jgi:peptidoglycan glycosyltransferase
MAKEKRKSRNREIMAVVYSFIILFLAIIGYMVYYNVYIKESVVNNTYNKRIEVMEQETIRGNILASDGTVLAKTVFNSDGEEERQYPYGNIFSHVIGYTYKGKSGIEKSANYYLISSNDNPIEQVKNDLSGNKNYGDSIMTTLDVDLQTAAYNALGSNTGAVVAIEPSTGKILAMVSKPDFDPNTLEIVWDKVTTESEFDSVLFNRATQGLYAPGSTFKVFTLLEYIRENPDTYQNFTFNCTGSVSFEGYSLRCINGTAHGSLTLKSAFAKSCNSTFATLGAQELDIYSYRENTLELLFNQELPFDFEYSQSSFELMPYSSVEDKMQTAMGQGETLMTPIHNCMIAAAIANDGVLMKPYLMDKIVNNSGSVIRKFNKEEYKTLMTKQEAEILTEYMTEVVTSGTGTALNTDAYTAAGKTGSAEYDSSGNHHSWFIGFAPVENPQIAICVLLEGGYTGYHSATEVARIVLDEYLAE